jgi:polysaccharide pyruvyl transferase WcaK-like protein
MNVFFVNDSTSNHNWGDRAAAISLKYMIAQYGGTICDAVTEDALKQSSFKEPFEEPTRIGAKIIRLLMPPAVWSVKRRLIHYLTESGSEDIIPRRWNEFDLHAQLLMERGHLYPRLLAGVRESEVIVIHGDGAIVGNPRIARAELFLAYFGKKYLKRPVILVNHTADFDHPVLREIAEHVYPLLDDVTFRDKISAERCLSICQGRYAPDSAFWFKPAKREEWAALAQRLTYMDVWPDMAWLDPNMPYICVGGTSAFSYDETPTRIINDWKTFLRHLRSVYQGQIVLTVSDIVDQVIFRPIAAELGLPLIGLTTPVQQAVDILGNADAYIGGRWHPSIFALRGGTPVVPVVSKTFKMRALMEMAGLEMHLYDAYDLAAAKDAVSSQLLDFLKQGETLRSRLRQWAGAQAEQSWDNVSYLRTYQGCVRPTQDIPKS